MAAVAALLAVPALAFGAAPANAAIPTQDDDGPPPVDCEPPDETVPFPDESWAQARLNFEKAWPFTNRGAGLKVAVIDSGVDQSHQQLANVDYDLGVLESGLENVDVDDVPPIQDCGGHGTAAAGVIAAQADPSFSSIVGVAPDVTLMPIRVTSGTDDYRPKNLAIAEAVRYAQQSDADIINISFETSEPFDPLEQAVTEAIDAGIVVVAASGNNGNQQAYPAAYPGVIGVGAIGQNGTITNFSGYGAPVSVVAPGSQVPVVARGGGHETVQGTSFAAPFVAGVAALVLDRYPDLSPAEVKRRIELTADETGHDLPHQKYGWGVVNPYAAVTEFLPDDETAGTPQAGEARAVIPPIQQPPPTDYVARNVAVGVAAGGLGLVLATLGGVAAYRRGRARGWRPGVPQQADPS